MRVRPFLKWAGGKYRCLDHIFEAFPQGARLVEPFTGSASVFLNADFPCYLLAEQNQDLINLFHCVQREGESFIADCQQLFCPSNNTSEQYYHLREQFNESRDPRFRAVIFLYLNRHGYNGLCRYNQKGIYNVPFGRYIKPYFPLLEMRHFYQKSQQALFVRGDFRETFKQAKMGDVIYCDPPYAPLVQTTNFTSYIDNKFGEDEQRDLARLAIEYAARGITVVISNHDTDFTRYHYQRAEIKSFPVRRTINSNISQRFVAKELIAIFR